MGISEISEKIKRYEQLREIRDQLKTNLAEAQKMMDDAEREIITGIMDLQDETQVEKMVVMTDGRRYSVTMKHYYSITKEQKERAFPLLRAVGLGDLIVERVDDRTLTKELATAAEENGGTLPEEFSELVGALSEYDKPSLSRTKA